MKTKTKLEFKETWRGGLSDYVTAIAWSPDRSNLAASSAAGEVSLFAAPTFGATSLQGETGESVDCLAFSHDGQFLAIGGQDGQVFEGRRGDEVLGRQRAQLETEHLVEELIGGEFQVLGGLAQQVLG